MKYIGLFCLACGFVTLLGLRHLAPWLPFLGAALFLLGLLLVFLGNRSSGRDATTKNTP